VFSFSLSKFYFSVRGAYFFFKMKRNYEDRTYENCNDRQFEGCRNYESNSRENCFKQRALSEHWYESLYQLVEDNFGDQLFNVDDLNTYEGNWQRFQSDCDKKVIAAKVQQTMEIMIQRGDLIRTWDNRLQLVRR